MHWHSTQINLTYTTAPLLCLKMGEVFICLFWFSISFAIGTPTKNCCQFFNKRLISVFSIESENIVLDGKATRLTLHLPETISPQEMLLNLTYTGKINDKMFGFYRQLFYLFILFLYVNFCASLDRPIKRMGTTQNNIWLPLSLRLISSL